MEGTEVGDSANDTVAIGEQPIVPDAVQSLGQHVDQETPDELMRGKLHGRVALTPLEPVVLALEGDGVVVG